MAASFRSPLLFLVLGFALGHAAAGTEIAPEVDDSPDQEDPRLDLLAAWFESEPSGVRFTVKIGAIDDNATDMIYFVSYDSGGARKLAGVGLDANGTRLAYLGPEGPGSNGEPPEAIANGALDRPTTRPGSPGYATAIIPLEPGARLENVSAGLSQYQRTRALWADVDFRGTDNTFTLERTIVPSAIGANAITIAIVAGLVILGISAGTFFGIRRARRDHAPKDPEAPRREKGSSRFGLGPKK